MPTRDIIVVGTSAGGVEALSRLVEGLPGGLPAALFVVCHLGGGVRSRLPEILSRRGRLPASHAREGEPIHPGHIYVAPPDYHVQLSPGAMHLSRGPRENRHRPAIDPLFRSAARLYGRRVVGVVLTGSLADGAGGLLAVRAAGGVAVIQDPAEAFAAGMPQTARDIAGADYVVPLAEIAPLLVRLVREPLADLGGGPMSDPLERLPERIKADMAAQLADGRHGQLSTYTCPDCGGSMWQVDERELTRFRCHTGHIYYAENLLAEQSEALEAALWTAVRIFKEKTVLGRQLAALTRERGEENAAVRFEEDAQLAERYAALIQEHVLGAGPPGSRSNGGSEETNVPVPPPAAAASGGR